MNKQTRGEKFQKSAKCEINHSSPMSNQACCDLNLKGDILELHDLCQNPYCKGQKDISFFSRQFRPEGAGFRNTTKKIFQGTGKMWNNFIKPVLKIATPIISAGVAVKTKTAQSAQTNSNVLESLTGGEMLSLIDIYGNGLRSKVT